ncbi:MAG TPA: radical SAM protein [Ktedonobacteraceae bacterium]|nr:radical SAM protein [Ktedonobacteraceae bacterium]
MIQPTQSQIMKLPTSIQIEPVGQCNLRCKMCSIQFRKDGPPYSSPAFMEYETFVNIIDQFSDLQELHLQGLGEPMMHPRFFDMVEYAVKKGIKVTTNSNLTLLNNKRAERCVTSGLHCLHISLDGATAETYERIRVRAHFEKVVANLERLLAARKLFNSEYPQLNLVMVIMRQNLHELPDIVHFAHRWSLKSIFVQHLCHDFAETSLPLQYIPMQEFVQGETLLKEDPQRTEYYFSEARKVARELDIDLRLPRTQIRLHPPGTPGPKRCNWPWSGTYFSYQGYAMPCCMVSTPDRINFGKISEQPVEELWNNSRYQEFRDQLSSEEPPEVCHSCSIYRGTF